MQQLKDKNTKDVTMYNKKDNDNEDEESVLQHSKNVPGSSEIVRVHVGQPALDHCAAGEYCNVPGHTTCPVPRAHPVTHSLQM